MGCSLEDLAEAMNDREKWRERVRNIHVSSMTSWWWWMIYKQWLNNKGWNGIKTWLNNSCIKKNPQNWIYIYIYIYTHTHTVNLRQIRKSLIGGESSTSMSYLTHPQLSTRNQTDPFCINTTSTQHIHIIYTANLRQIRVPFIFI